MSRIAAGALALVLAGCSSSLTQSAMPDAPQQPAASAATPGDAPESSADEAPVSDGSGGALAAPETSQAAVPAAPAAALRDEAGGAAPSGYHGQALARAFGRAAACNRAAPYCASDLQAAYGLTASSKSGGRGLTVAVVSAYGYARAEKDLAVYRKSMGLPPCTAHSGCLKIRSRTGRGSPPLGPGAAEASWQLAAAIQLDMISAICPNCKILLVLARSAADGDLSAAVDAAAQGGAAAIATGYAAPESLASATAYDRPGRVIAAAAGDGGYGAQQPCSFAGVVCVGGTSLAPPAGARRAWNERAWQQTGSGCSAFVPKPPWQRGDGCAMRSETDVAAVADPQTGVAVYEAARGGWLQAGGTAAASAVVAALFALGPSAARSNAPAWIWRHAGSAAYRDVTAGSNGSCSIQYLCQAREGYDGPTGWGSPARVSGF